MCIKLHNPLHSKIAFHYYKRKFGSYRRARKEEYVLGEIFFQIVIISNLEEGTALLCTQDVFHLRLSSKAPFLANRMSMHFTRLMK